MSPDLANAIDKLTRYGLARNRRIDRTPRDVTLTDDEAVAALDVLVELPLIRIALTFTRDLFADDMEDENDADVAAQRLAAVTAMDTLLARIAPEGGDPT